MDQSDDEELVIGATPSKQWVEDNWVSTLENTMGILGALQEFECGPTESFAVGILASTVLTVEANHAEDIAYVRAAFLRAAGEVFDAGFPRLVKAHHGFSGRRFLNG